MKLKEEYNKTATLEMLKKILYKDEALSSRRTEISFDEIYDILGYSKGRYPSSTDANAFWKHFPTYQAQSMWYDEEAAYDTYITQMNKAYDCGDYFHFDFNEGTATERMIINVTNQSSSLKLSQSLLSLQIQAPFTTSKYQIRKFKTYLKGSSTSDRFFKNDKMVIYYDRSYRNCVYDSIVQAAKQCGIISTDFSSTISAFYHLVTDDDDTLPVGIAVENNSTISFTDSCANSILQQLTGINLFDESESAKENEEYEIKNTLEAEGIFTKVVEDCCKSFNE